MKKLGVVIASIAGIAGLAMLGNSLLHQFGSGSVGQFGFVTQTPPFDCSNVDLDQDQCEALYYLYEANPNSSLLKEKFKQGNTVLCNGGRIQCENGKIILLNLYNNKISNITSLESLTSLRTLNLNSNTINDISSLNGLINLNWLYLNNNQICSSISSTIALLTNLSKILIYNNYIDWLNSEDPLITEKISKMDTNYHKQSPTKCPSKQKKYSCSTLKGCYEDKNGTYTDLKVCTSTCKTTINGKEVDIEKEVGGEKTRYSCSTLKGCYEDKNGTYTDLKVCTSACKTTINGKEVDIEKEVGGEKNPLCGSLNGTYFYDNGSKCTRLEAYTYSLCADGSLPTLGPISSWKPGYKQWWLWSCNYKRGSIENPYYEDSGGYSCFAHCSYCGDGIVNSYREQCDDGNDNDNDTCRNTCKKHQ